MMDLLVINHTAKDSVLVEQHPDGYLRDADGNLISPGCEEPDGTMVKWEDLAELDYENTGIAIAALAFRRRAYDASAPPSSSASTRTWNCGTAAGSMLCGPSSCPMPAASCSRRLARSPRAARDLGAAIEH
jgi:hypothetical protein